MVKRSRLSRKLPFAHDRRLRIFSLGDFVAQGEDYDAIMADAGVRELDNERSMKMKLSRFLKGAGAVHG
jgi:hypothetical protein